MTYYPERPTPEQIQAEVEDAMRATAADVAKLRPRDSQPLAGYLSGWTK